MTTQSVFDIKICGLSTRTDVAAAIDGGATMIGLVFFEKSPRHVTFEAAADLAAFARDKADSKIQIVALTVDADYVELEAICTDVQPDILQLHGSETADRVRHVKAITATTIMKAIGVSEAADFERLRPYSGVADRLLVDAKPPKGSVLPGGNGLTFDWSILDALTPDICGGLPVMLSGGLTPANITAAVQLSHAHPVISGIDVSSGVETSPGIKDKDLIETFLQRAQAAAA
ncbi:phosphoribosylanthranilate isomerase [Pararhizobium sp. IMCC21322]|uniref:phosphoribosylanthranilate isomerase n=1 Tax=Pararhizobium sp. IMCC21322 TaxID=3067903 RepID=UPI002740BCF0|nr:phosphoribosylanthranilate isomerase [Pararhizobium sp. IMCC21322]